MSKTFDELMKILNDQGEIPDEKAKAIIAEHGPLSEEEKKQLAAAIKMKKALTKKDDQKKEDKPGDGEVSMDDYIQALSVLDSEAATAEEKEKAKKVIDKFESQ